jgi:hypothetical protein
MLLALGTEFLEYIFSQYGTYILIAFFLIPCIAHAIYNIIEYSDYYFIKEAPFGLPIAFLVILIMPIFDKNGYPLLRSEGGLIYYAFLSIPVILVVSDLFAWVAIKLCRKQKTVCEKGTLQKPLTGDTKT